MVIAIGVFLASSLSNCQSGRSDSGSHASSIVVGGVADTTSLLRSTRGIRDILEDRQGNLWFASTDYICVYNGDSIRYFFQEEGLGIVGYLHEDTDGNILIENGQRIYKYDGAHFHEVEVQMGLWPDDDFDIEGDIWFSKGVAMSDEDRYTPGAYRLRNDRLSFFPFPIEESVGNRFLYYPSTKAIRGQDSTIWFGSMEKIFGLKEGEFVVLGREEMQREDDSREIGIRGLFVDKEGLLWIADNGAGVFVFDGNEVVNFTRQYQLDEDTLAGPTLHRAFSISEDNQGNIWIGTVYSGIWKFDKETEILTNYSKNHGVLSENIWLIYQLRDGGLLFAGESPGGVYEFSEGTFNRVF